MKNFKSIVSLKSTNIHIWSYLFFTFTCANTEDNEETGHLEEQGGEKQGEEVKAGLSVCLNN